jgi:hypothetical protein
MVLKKTINRSKSNWRGTMHPLNSKYFGANGIKTSFYNGASVVAGYITKQIAPAKFVMTDGTYTKTVALAPTTAIATALGSGNPKYGTIPVYGLDSDATGGSFAVHYGVYSATVVTSGAHWNVSDTLSAPSGAGVLTVASLTGGSIATVTVSTAGTYTALFSSPTTFARAAGSGGSFTPHYGVDSALIAAGGALSAAGYHAADVLTLATSGSATIIVDTVDGGGGILTYHVGAIGTVTALGTTRAVTGGAGTGATFDLRWKLLAATAGVTSSGGTAYNVGDTLIFAGFTAVTQPTAHISVATSHAATTVTVDTVGSGITVAGTITTSTTAATFNLTYTVVSITSSSGSGYAVNDELFFEGIVAATLPAAHISTATLGAATATTVATAGTGITAAATSISIAGSIEYANHIYATKLVTTTGNHYGWSLGTSVNGSAVIKTYNDDLPSF